MSEEQREAFINWQQKWLSQRAKKLEGLMSKAQESLQKRLQPLIRDSRSWEQFEPKSKHIKQEFTKVGELFQNQITFASMKAMVCLQTQPMDKCVADFEKLGSETVAKLERSLQSFV